jgi:NADH dehydrogenase
VPQPDGITSPPTAQHALRQAETCAANILATIRGERRQPFGFTGLGKLGSLGRYSAVAEVMGIRLSGFVAWLLWRGIYLSKFPGFERKLRILADWLHDVFLHKDITQTRLFNPDEVHPEHFEPGEYVIHEGDFGDKIYFVVRGELEVLKNGSAVNTLKTGDLFGEIALISNSPRTATIRAQVATDVVSVRRNAFHQILAHVPGVKQTMESIMERHLGRRVDWEEDRV